MFSNEVQRVINSFLKLPGCGTKTAQRYALHLLKQSKEEIQEIASNIVNMKAKTKYCSMCCGFTEEDICSVCSSEKRDPAVICIVSDIKDMMAIEATESYRGYYFITHGLIDPMEGIGPADVHLIEFFKRVLEQVQEVIVAFPDTIEAAATTLYLTKVMKSANIKISRIAFGVASGTYLDQADPFSLANSLKGRKEL